MINSSFICFDPFFFIRTVILMAEIVLLCDFLASVKSYVLIKNTYYIFVRLCIKVLL